MSCSTCKPGPCPTQEACAADAGAAPRLPKTFKPVVLDGPYPLARRERFRRRWPWHVRAVGWLVLLAVLLATGFLFFYHR